MDKDTLENLPEIADRRVGAEKVSLGGFAVSKDGTLTKSQYFKFLDYDLDDYDDIYLTPSDARRLYNHLSRLSTGGAAVVPLYCAGDKCPFASSCPLQRAGRAPVLKVCPIEGQLIKEYTRRYANEFSIDPENWTEVGYVNELAEIDIYLIRLKQIIARPENAELVTEQAVGVTTDGRPIVQKQISPYLDQMERFQNRKSKIIKLMVGDRQEKYKKQAALKEKDSGDTSAKMSKVKSKLDALARRLTSIAPEEDIETPESLFDE